MSVTTNTFSDGLITDLNPLATPNSVLTNCINGTITTFNGNEFALQNDLGNVKMENIKFPPGFIPVGMKEYAGIIYVALLNPKTKNCQIGSFPSPGQLEPIENADERSVQVELKDDTSKYEYDIIKDELNPGDYYKLNLTDNAENTPNIKSYFDIVYNYIIDSKKVKCNIGDVIISNEQQDAFNYFKGKSGSTLNVDFNKKEPEYFNVNIIPKIKTGESNTLSLSIWAKAYNKTIELFKGIRVKCTVGADIKTKYFDSNAGGIIQLPDVITGLKKGEMASVEITPYSKYHIFENKKYVETFDTSNIMENPTSDANTIFKYFASNNKISIDFDFKVNDPNVKLYVEAYDPIADCSTVKAVDQSTTTGINQIVFDLVDEKKPATGTTINGISEDLIRIKLDNEDEFKAIMPKASGSGEQIGRLIRVKDQLRLNHYYVFRICAISTIEGVQSYSYVIKSLYTFDSFNQYYNTIKDFDKIKINTKDYLSFSHKVNSDIITGSEDGVSEYDSDCAALSTENTNKEIIPYLINPTSKDLHYTHYQTYNKKREIDLSISCDSSKMFGTINDVISSNDPVITTTLKDDFTPVKKINNPITGKEKGESSIISSFTHATKSLNHKLSFDYLSYRNSIARSYDTNTTTSIASYELYPISVTLPNKDNSNNHLIVDLGRQLGDCFYKFNGVTKYFWPRSGARFDDDLDDIITELRTSAHFNKSNICACVMKPLYSHLYWATGAFSEANDVAQAQLLNNYCGYKGDNHLHPWDSLESRVGTSYYKKNCGILVILSKDDSQARTLFLRVFDISDIDAFFNKTYVCSHKSGLFYCYYPRLANGGFKNLSSAKTLFTHSAKIDAKVSIGNLFSFKSFRDEVVRQFNLSSIKTMIPNIFDGALNKDLITNTDLFPVLNTEETIQITPEITDYSIEKPSNSSVFDYWSLGNKGFVNITNTTPPTTNGSLYIKPEDLDSVKIARLKDSLEVLNLDNNPFTSNDITANNFRINLKSVLTAHTGMWSNQKHSGNEDGPNMADNYFYKQ